MVDGPHRLFRLLDLLQGRRSQTTSSLAEALGVSERTIRRDLARLGELDVAVDRRPGRGGGVSIPPDALLAPLRFTDDELLALHLGLLSLPPGRDDRLARAAAGAAVRLERVLTPRARERARALAAAVAAPRTPTATGADAASDLVLATAQAVHARRRLTMRYASSAGRETTRDVDPYGLVRLQSWYLAAHCHLRGAIRTFRLDRIRSLDEHGATFDRPVDFDAVASVAASIALAPKPGSVLCRVHVEVGIEAAAARLPPAAVVLEPAPSGVLLSTRPWREELESIALHLLHLPWPVTVLEPEDLREAMRAVGRRALVVADRRLDPVTAVIAHASPPT